MSSHLGDEQREVLDRVVRTQLAALHQSVAAARADSEAEARLVDTLVRLRRPDFGRCIDCNDAIPFRRLLADPQLQRCFACETVVGRVS